jgi:hypothetical protein
MKRFWSYVSPWIGGAASVITIYLTWHQCSDVTSPAGRTMLIALLFLIVFLLALLGIQQFNFGRKCRYAEIVSSLNQVYSEVQALTMRTCANGPAVTPDEIRLGCTAIVNILASLLSLVTGTRCAVCIKVMELGDAANAPRPKVVTLCRDQISTERTKGDDEHWVDQNTDFEELLKGVGTPLTCFYRNYLPWLHGYKNTSFKTYGQPMDLSFPVVGSLLRSLMWTLPYRSTIVAPIASPDQNNDERRLSGYLCVDSRSMGVFRRRFDVDVVTGIANNLHQVVHHLMRGLADNRTAEGPV